MGYTDYLKDLLRPLGVYNLSGIGGGELETIGGELDICFKVLEEIETEMLVLSATEGGLSAVESLLARRPAASTLQRRRDALAALLRVGGDSFTLSAINDTLKGCGINAVASETDRAGVVEVEFPDVPGMPDEMDEIVPIMEDILPCHVQINYIYWYVTWLMVESKFPTWAALEGVGLTWNLLEKLVV